MAGEQAQGGGLQPAEIINYDDYIGDQMFSPEEFVDVTTESDPNKGRDCTQDADDFDEVFVMSEVFHDEYPKLHANEIAAALDDYEWLEQENAIAAAIAAEAEAMEAALEQERAEHARIDKVIAAAMVAEEAALAVTLEQRRAENARLNAAAMEATFAQEEAGNASHSAANNGGDNLEPMNKADFVDMNLATPKPNKVSLKLNRASLAIQKPNKASPLMKLLKDGNPVLKLHKIDETPQGMVKMGGVAAKPAKANDATLGLNNKRNSEGRGKMTIYVSPKKTRGNMPMAAGRSPQLVRYLGKLPEMASGDGMQNMQLGTSAAQMPAAATNAPLPLENAGNATVRVAGMGGNIPLRLACKPTVRVVKVDNATLELVKAGIATLKLDNGVETPVVVNMVKGSRSAAKVQRASAEGQGEDDQSTSFKKDENNKDEAKKGQ